MKTMFFSHDSDSSNDRKIIWIEYKYGLQGYAWFFKIIEQLSKSDCYQIELTEIEKGVLQSTLKFPDRDTFDSFINDCVEVELLILEDNFISSNSLRRRMKFKDIKKENGSKGGRPPKTDKEEKLPENTGDLHEYLFEFCQALNINNNKLNGWITKHGPEKVKNVFDQYELIVKEKPGSPIGYLTTVLNGDGNLSLSKAINQVDNSMKDYEILQKQREEYKDWIKAWRVWHIDSGDVMDNGKSMFVKTILNYSQKN